MVQGTWVAVLVVIVAPLVAAIGVIGSEWLSAPSLAEHRRFDFRFLVALLRLLDEIGHAPFEGLQVRDILHVDDLYDLLTVQLQDIGRHRGMIYNVGGGAASSGSFGRASLR